MTIQKVSDLQEQLVRSLEDLPALTYVGIAESVNKLIPQDPEEIASIVLGRKFVGDVIDYEELGDITNGAPRNYWLTQQLWKTANEYTRNRKVEPDVEGEEIIDEDWF